MIYKLDNQNWSHFDFLINSFYEIVEYKRGRGIYGDRLILRRPKNPSSVFGEPDKMYEFYYLDARSVKELPMTKAEKIKIVLRFVSDPEKMNKIVQGLNVKADIFKWSLETRQAIINAKTTDYNILNDILVKQYEKIGGDFISKLNKQRVKEYYLASNENMQLVSKEYADVQLHLLEK